MKISKKWLQEFVFLPDSLTPQELAKELSLRTVEVEGIENQAELLENVVVGLIEKVEQHPNADKLKVCHVNVGNESLQIVCGGSNVKEKQKVALAKVGAKVKWHGEGELIELTPTAIRGVESFGMICGSDEIGLAEKFPKKDEKEIVDLSAIKAKPGTPLAKAIGYDDVTFEIDNKSLSNRPDLWGQYGMAREIATIYRKNLAVYKTPAIAEGKEVDLKVSVENTALCPRYMAVAIDGIKIQASPAWMQERLIAVGIRPINVIVDITNFVMMELGQPMHAFDASKLSSSEIIVRTAKEGEKFVTLDEKERNLEEGMLLICDKEKSLAIAGVMGGKNSEVNDNTNRIIFESANFDGASIRKTSTKLGLRTDASARFEKSLDPTLADTALKRAVELTLDLCPGAKVVSKVSDVFNYTFAVDKITIPTSLFEKKIGVALPEKEITKILDRLGFKVKKEKKSLVVQVPSWRATKDISIPEDIVEEVLRIFGYENVPATLPDFPITPPVTNHTKSIKREVKNILALECGFTETYNYSFVSPEWLHTLEVEALLHIELENPIAKDRPLLRRSIIPNLLQNVESNLHRSSEVKMFETGRVYRIEEAGERVEPGSDELLPQQDTMLGMVFASKSVEVPFFALRAALEAMCSRLHVEYTLCRESTDPLIKFPSWSHPGRTSFIVVNNQIVGAIGELHPKIQKQAGIDARTAWAEINLNLWAEVMKEKIVYHPLSLYPSVYRDLAFVVEKTTPHAQIVSTIESIDPLVRSVELFDVFEGEKIGSSKKSVAYHIEYRSDECTLAAEEIDALQKKVIQAVEKDLKAEIRK